MEQEKFTNIAESALKKHYDGSFVSVKFFTKETSVIYQVRDSNCRKFALKIYEENYGHADDNLIELLVLEAIEEKGTVNTVRFIKNKDGQRVTIYQDESGTKHRITLSTWLQGVDFKDNESEEYFFKLGQLLAELHTITKDITIPAGVKAKKWDEVFYFRDETAVYHDAKYDAIVNPEFKALMDTAIPLLNHKLKEIYHAETPQLLHGDLNPWNIKIHNKQLSVLDFEDAILGHPIHDIAILLFYYTKNKHFKCKFVKKYVLKGYTSINDVPYPPDDDIEWLMMARQVNFLNYILTLEGDHIAYIQEGLTKLKTFLKIHE